VPGYDFDSCPFFVVRDKISVSVINVKREQITMVIPTCPLSLDTVERTSFFEIESTDDQRIFSLYNLEVEKKERDKPSS
jgi:hypothetical protein